MLWFLRGSVGRMRTHRFDRQASERSPESDSWTSERAPSTWPESHDGQIPPPLPQTHQPKTAGVFVEVSPYSRSLRMKMRRALAIILITGVIVYLATWIPWLILRANPKIVSSIEDIDKHDVAIIFGGLYENGHELTETNRERLLAGATLIKEEIVTRLVVSNTPKAVQAMEAFLLEQGVAESQIELDTTAVVTADSCVAERNTHPESRSVIFVSHGYHLPRILYACHRLGVSGVGVPAEEIVIIDRQELSQFDTLQIRFVRNQREAALTLLNILGVYGPTLEKEF